jgi:hypothetical protein
LHILNLAGDRPFTAGLSRCIFHYDVAGIDRYDRRRVAMGSHRSTPGMATGKSAQWRQRMVLPSRCGRHWRSSADVAWSQTSLCLVQIEQGPESNRVLLTLMHMRSPIRTISYRYRHPSACHTSQQICRKSPAPVSTIAGAPSFVLITQMISIDR